MDVIVLASGNGSTFQAIVERCTTVKVKALFCNNPGAKVIERAHRESVPALVGHPKRLMELVDETAELFKPQLIVLAGYMKILPPEFVERWKFRIVNIHPSLLPKYKGLNTYEQVLASDDEYHGTTAHVVTDELDDGPIISQRKFVIFDGETPGELAERTHKHEWEFYPQILDGIANEHYILPEKDGDSVLRRVGHEFLTWEQLQSLT